MGASQLGIAADGSTKLEPPAPMQPPEPDKATLKGGQPFPCPMSKQNSILSLTLDEIQFRSGKNFGSMNMDEFLASIWSVEENQTSQNQTDNNNKDNKKGPALAGQSNLLTRQGSFSIPTPLCNKTVDEVWYEIHKDNNRLPVQPNNSSTDILEPLPRQQQTFGEMTLEDFLVKAGVVQEGGVAPSLTTLIQKQTAGFPDSVTPYGTGFVGSSLSGNAFMAATYQLCGQNSNRHVGEVMGEMMHERCNTLAEVVGLKNRRIIDGPPEVVVERRQRRMIKNRESAARSRARKQAYTVELEVELNQLKEENEKLKRIMEETEQKRRKEVSKRKCPTKADKVSAKVRTMRRTVSNAW